MCLKDDLKFDVLSYQFQVESAQKVNVFLVNSIVFYRVCSFVKSGAPMKWVKIQLFRTKLSWSNLTQKAHMG